MTDIIEKLEYVKEAYGCSTVAYEVALSAQVVINGLRLEARLEARLNDKANKSKGVRRRPPSRKVKRNRMV